MFNLASPRGQATKQSDHMIFHGPRGKNKKTHMKAEWHTPTDDPESRDEA